MKRKVAGVEQQMAEGAAEGKKNPKTFINMCENQRHGSKKDQSFLSGEQRVVKIVE